MITSDNKTRILSVLSIFETGHRDGDYGDVTILKDGKNDDDSYFHQITYGRHQTTEQSHLKALLNRYVAKDGTFADEIRPFIDQIGKGALVKHESFLDSLRKAGREDPIMRSTQDNFFDEVYYNPAFKFFNDNGFTLPLSMLVIYDSYIHSGSIKDYLRKRFAAKVPVKGGEEKNWVTSYVRVRHEWLSNHPNEILQRTNYRTKAFQKEIDRDNWDLSMPVETQGKVSRSMPRL
jgi:chitosanase